jgi:S1-C subfamily serine protease
MLRIVLSALVVVLTLVGASPAAAERDADLALLWTPFDGGALTANETRVVQAMLAATDDYAGLVDGAWGEASQRALERHAARLSGAEFDGKARNWHMMAAVSAGLAAIGAERIIYHVLPAQRVAIAASVGPHDGAERLGGPSERLGGDGVTVLAVAHDAAQARDLHAWADGRITGAEAHRVRGEDRWITGGAVGAGAVHVRSDFTGSGWTSVVVEAERGASPPFRVIAASVTTDLDARFALREHGPLATIGAAFERVMNDDDDGADPQPSMVDPDDAGAAPEGSGTAFFVTDAALVTAAHVVEGCARPAFADGTDLRVLARHPTLDLALLTSTRRSRDWVGLDRTGSPRLGQTVFALGYPFYGVAGTALSVTAGNVSALSGLDDDPRVIAVSSPVQPGSSGGPLIGADGALIGVVVARLSREAMESAAGAAPENVNFAVTGLELVGFLADNGVAVGGASESFQIADGVPDGLQRAVVPVLCLDR